MMCVFDIFGPCRRMIREPSIYFPLCLPRWNRSTWNIGTKMQNSFKNQLAKDDPQRNLRTNLGFLGPIRIVELTVEPGDARSELLARLTNRKQTFSRSRLRSAADFLTGNGSASSSTTGMPGPHTPFFQGQNGPRSTRQYRTTQSRQHVPATKSVMTFRHFGSCRDSQPKIKSQRIRPYYTLSSR